MSDEMTALERMELKLDIMEYYLSNDAYASSFQTMGQYRAALLKKLRIGMEADGEI